MTTENLPQTQNNKNLTTQNHDLSVIEQVVMQGDLSKLNPDQRVTYYHKVCESLGLNPYTKPFAYISLNGQLQLYAKKDATEQLRSVKKISITSLEGKIIDDLYIVTAKATTPDGRIDQSTGAVTIGHLKGDAKANAIMKAETKAKRRVTLSMAGLGWVDESEVDSIPLAKPVNVDMRTGEIQVECEDLTQNYQKNNDQNVRNSNTLTLNEENKQSTLSQEPKISFDQLSEIMIGFAKTTDVFKKSCLQRMFERWNVKEFEDLPCSAYEPILTGIQRNIESQTMVKNENN